MIGAQPMYACIAVEQHNYNQKMTAADCRIVAPLARNSGSDSSSS
jgi:hypothetical protein